MRWRDEFKSEAETRELIKISETIRSLIKEAAKKLKGPRKREFIAEVTLNLLEGNARKAEREFGWGRETVQKGIREIKTRIQCIDNYSGRGNKKTEDRMPRLMEHIRAIVDPQERGVTRCDEVYFRPGKMTAKSVRQALMDVFKYTDDQLPHENTIGNILKRMGYQMGNFLMEGRHKMREKLGKGDGLTN
jgi:hypothetical protein